MWLDTLVYNMDKFSVSLEANVGKINSLYGELYKTFQKAKCSKAVKHISYVLSLYGLKDMH